MIPCDGIVFDVDGVLWVDEKPAPGAPELLSGLRRAHTKFSLLTNSCNLSHDERHSELSSGGLPLLTGEIVTAVDATRAWLVDHEVRTILYLGSPKPGADLAAVTTLCNHPPVDAVVVGDLFACYDRGLLEVAAAAIRDAAILLAMQKNRRWWNGSRWVVDLGFWVAGLEYVSRAEAVIVGKPSRHAYDLARRAAGTAGSAPSKTLFVSDDIDVDLYGAWRAGLRCAYIGQQREVPQWIDICCDNLVCFREMVGGDVNDRCCTRP